MEVGEKKKQRRKEEGRVLEEIKERAKKNVIREKKGGKR